MKIITDLRQRHLEAWFDAYNNEIEDGIQSANGVSVRSAIKADIVTGITANDVADMKPYEVDAIAKDVNILIEDARKPPEKK